MKNGAACSGYLTPPKLGALENKEDGKVQSSFKQELYPFHNHLPSSKWREMVAESRRNNKAVRSYNLVWEVEV